MCPCALGNSTPSSPLLSSPSPYCCIPATVIDPPAKRSLPLPLHSTVDVVDLNCPQFEISTLWRRIPYTTYSIGCSERQKVRIACLWSSNCLLFRARDRWQRPLSPPALQGDAHAHCPILHSFSIFRGFAHSGSSLVQSTASIVDSVCTMMSYQSTYMGHSTLFSEYCTPEYNTVLTTPSLWTLDSKHSVSTP